MESTQEIEITSTSFGEGLATTGFVHVEGTEIPLQGELSTSSEPLMQLKDADGNIIPIGNLSELKQAMKQMYGAKSMYRYNMATVLNKQRAEKNRVAKRRAKKKK